MPATQPRSSTTALLALGQRASGGPERGPVRAARLAQVIPFPQRRTPEPPRAQPRLAHRPVFHWG